MCWNCGHLGHITRHCFRCMRQRKRHGCLQDEIDAISSIDLIVVGADAMFEYTSDADLTFASSFSPNVLMYVDYAIPLQWLLDVDARCGCYVSCHSTL